MPERLLLRLSPSGDARWLRQAADGRVLQGASQGFPPASALGEAEIVVLVPAEDVLLAAATVAARNRAQLMQAIPFAIEDQLLAPVEDLHFAASARVGDAVGIAVVAKATLRAWLDRLASAGLRADVLLPESLALPFAPDRATALLENDRAIVRRAEWSAFACATSELPSWLAQANAEREQPIDIHDFRDASAPRLPIGAASAPSRERDALTFLARSLRAPPLNLLEGEFAPQHRAARGARWWRIAAALAAAVIALAVVDLGAEVVQLSRASARMDALEQDAVRKAFPDVNDADFARATASDIARSRIERLRGGAERSGFLRMLAAIAPVLGSTTQIQTRGLDYRNGSLELGLRAPDVATLDSVRERLAAVPGLKVAVTAANPADGGIDGRIRIADAGGAP